MRGRWTTSVPMLRANGNGNGGIMTEFECLIFNKTSQWKMVVNVWQEEQV
jgi:hypothetical protein